MSGPGVLTFQLSQPRQLALTSGGGDRLQLQLQAGSATLQLLAPVQVVIKPPPEEVDQLLWNGQALMAEANRPGTYRVDATRAAAQLRCGPRQPPALHNPSGLHSELHRTAATASSSCLHWCLVC